MTATPAGRTIPRSSQAYLEAGAECLPVIQQSIKPPEVVNGKVVGRIGPDRNWMREISSVILAFPRSRVGN